LALAHHAPSLSAPTDTFVTPKKGTTNWATPALPLLSIAKVHTALAQSSLEIARGKRHFLRSTRARAREGREQHEVLALLPFPHRDFGHVYIIPTNLNGGPKIGARMQPMQDLLRLSEGERS
jgi:hypothetical protein